MIIGLTGGIGSGKTTALDALRELGYKVFSCDDAVKKLYKKRKVLRALKKEFPQAVTGGLFLKADKKKIAQIIFADKNKYEFLTDFLAKKAFDDVYKKAVKLKGDSVIEVPLLFEKGFADKFDKVIVIKRDIKRRVESVKTRSMLSEEEIKARINSQIDYEKADLSAYVVIENDGTIESLKEKLRAVL